MLRVNTLAKFLVRACMPVMFVASFALHVSATPQDSISHVLSKAPNDSVRIEILFDLVRKMTEKGNGVEIKRYTDQMMVFSKAIKYYPGISKAWFLMAASSLAEGDYAKSLKYYLKAATIDDSIHSKWLSHDYDGLGDLFSQEKNKAMALTYYKKAEKLAFEFKDAYALNLTYKQLGKFYDTYGISDTALIYSKKALEFYKTGDPVMANEIRGDMANSYQRLGNFKQAEAYYAQNLEFYGKENDNNGMAVTYNNLSAIYHQNHELDKALANELKALSLISKMRDRFTIESFYQNLAMLYEEKKDYKQSVKYLWDYTDLHDSLLNERSSKTVTELATKYETAKKEKEIAKLTEKEDVQKAQLGQQRVIIVASLAFALLILLTAGLFYFNMSKIKKLSVSLTEQRNQLETKSKSLEELNALKDKLFSIISHDLRNPLINTHALLELLHLGELSDEKAKRYSAELSESLQHNIQLLDNLLNWAASQIKGMEINKIEMNAKDLIDENIQAIKGAADKKGIIITEDIHQEGNILADLSMARLVMRNLLSNAMKFTPRGGTIAVESSIMGSFVNISVRDTGIGLDEALKNSIFSDKVQKSAPGTDLESGFGIGLQLCKEFVEKNGGEINVKSSPGKGSTFSFTLPLAA